MDFDRRNDADARRCTKYQQANNKRTSKFITFNGKTATVKEFADEYGIAYSCLYARLRNGWSVENALITPAKQIKKMTNAQKIRAMSDEELAKFMNLCGHDFPPYCDVENSISGQCDQNCIKCAEEWLKQPTE